MTCNETESVSINREIFRQLSLLNIMLIIGLSTDLASGNNPPMMAIIDNISSIFKLTIWRS